MRLRKLDEARANDDVARKTHQLRTNAGFTQAQLAKLIGSTTSVISRLERPLPRHTPPHSTAASRSASHPSGGLSNTTRMR